MTNGKHGNGAILGALGIGGLAVVLVMAAMGGAFSGGAGSLFAGNAITSPPTSPFAQAPTEDKRPLGPGDDIKITPSHFDALANTAETEGTDVTTTYYWKNANGGFTPIGSGSGTQIQMGSVDPGIIYIGLEPQAAADSEVLALERTKIANPDRVTSAQYIDVEPDGDKEYIVGFSTAGLKNREDFSGNVPDFRPLILWYEEAAVTVTGASGTAPADKTALGTSQVTTYVQWGLDGTASSATFLNELELKVNSTDTTDWDEGTSSISFLGNVYSLSSIRDDQDGTYTYYRIKFPVEGNSDLSKAMIVEFPPNQLDIIPVVFKAVVTLDTGDQHGWTLQAEYLSESDVVASSSDTVGFADD